MFDITGSVSGCADPGLDGGTLVGALYVDDFTATTLSSPNPVTIGGDALVVSPSNPDDWAIISLGMLP